MGRAGRKKVANNFSQEKVIDKYTQLLELLVDKKFNKHYEQSATF
jgi:hypothetical protein